MPKPVYTYVPFVNIIKSYHTKTKQLIYSHTSKYLQVFLCDISLFSNDSVFFKLFLSISTNSNIILFSNNLLSVD